MSGGDTGRLRAYNEQIAADDPRLGCELNDIRDAIEIDARGKVCSFQDCGGSHYVRGYCSLHYQRLRRDGQLPPLPEPDPKAEAIKRFMAKFVVVESGCWIWDGAIGGGGYGNFYDDRKKVVAAHRFSYRLKHGDYPTPGLHLDHLCRQHPCVNPDHLELVTPRENILRGVGPAAVNAVMGTCRHGHEFTADNTRICRRADGRTFRICIQCQNERNHGRRLDRRDG